MKKLFAVISVILVFTLLCSCGETEKEVDYKLIAETALSEYKESKSDENLNPIAALVLKDKSVVLMELYPEVAPNTVNNFVKLSNSGFYDGLIFHRIIKDFMVQGGDPLGTGRGDPGYSIVGEFSNNNIANDIEFETGVLAMARAGSKVNPQLYYNTAGSQFFICVADCSWLNNDYAAFGKVISGMEYISALSLVETGSEDKPVETQYIECIRVETFGVSYPEPETILN